ncbi:MAG: PaaI family thioesterase, partial [Pseudomonadota bacterium]|nr:PaaI family thioesterase [Pseudomonadota bacterium]
MSPNSLDQWLADEKAVFERLENGPGPGVTPLEQAARLSGLALMQAMLRGEVPYAPIAKTLDFMLIEAAKGRAVFQGTPGPQLFNPMGTVHGGWFATLLDSALGCAVHTMMPAGRAYTTAELGVNLVKAITP